MPVRDLQQVEEHIAKTRGHIDVQIRLIQKLRKEHLAREAVIAEGFLEFLEESLAALMKWRKILLHQIRQPSAVSHPQPHENGASGKRPRRSAS